jgi:hypothetical protein
MMNIFIFSKIPLSALFLLISIGKIGNNNMSTKLIDLPATYYSQPRSAVNLPDVDDATNVSNESTAEVTAVCQKKFQKSFHRIIVSF